MVKNLAVSIATYFKLVESVDSKIDKLLSKEYESAVMLLEQARCVTTPQVYVNLLIAAIERFNVAVTLEQRERQLLAYLGLMLCYYYLGETSVICKIQEIFRSVEVRMDSRFPQIFLFCMIFHV